MDFVNGGRGVIFCVFLAIFFIKSMLKTNRERSERRKIREKLAFSALKKHRTAAIRGRAPGSASVTDLCHQKSIHVSRYRCLLYINPLLAISPTICFS